MRRASGEDGDGAFGRAGLALAAAYFWVKDRRFRFGLCAAALLSWIYYFGWWAEDQHYRSPLLLLVLALALVYSFLQMVANWWLYLVARSPQEPPASAAGIMSQCAMPSATCRVTSARNFLTFRATFGRFCFRRRGGSS